MSSQHATCSVSLFLSADVFLVLTNKILVVRQTALVNSQQCTTSKLITLLFYDNFGKHGPIFKMFSLLKSKVWYGILEFNVPLDTS